MGTINEEIGKRVQDTRGAAKMSRPFLAEKVGLTDDIIYHIERGERSLKADEVDKFAAALGVPAIWISEGRVPNTPSSANVARGDDLGEVRVEPVATGLAERPSTAPPEGAVPGRAEEPATPLPASLAPLSAESPKPAVTERNPAPTSPQSMVPGRAEGPSVPLAVNLESVPVEAPKIARPEASPEPAPADDHQPTPPKGVKATLRRMLIAVLPPIVVTVLGSERRRLLTWIVGYCVCAGVFIVFPAVPLRWHALGVAVCGFFILQLSLRFNALDREARATRPYRARGSA